MLDFADLTEEIYNTPEYKNYMEREHHIIYAQGHVESRPDFCLTCQEYLKQQRRDDMLEFYALRILGMVIIIPTIILSVLFVGQLVWRAVSMVVGGN